MVGTAAFTGVGSRSDPKRPLFAPWPLANNPNGIIAFTSLPASDGNSVVVEFVARSREGLLPLLRNGSGREFERGRTPKATIEAALKPLRGDFSLDDFGVELPTRPAALRPARARPYLAETFASVDRVKWSVAGEFKPGGHGLVAPNSAGGSAISRIPVPDGGQDAEVRATVTLANPGGTYILLLQASPDAQISGDGRGSYLAFEMENPRFEASGLCAADFAVLESDHGVVSLIGAFEHSCHDGMEIRFATRGNLALAWLDDATPFVVRITPRTGQPGVGARATASGNGIGNVQLGSVDRIAPAAVDADGVRVAAYRNHVDAQWKAVEDDAEGSGMEGYWIYRDGEYLMRTAAPRFIDEAVTPGAQHTYTIYAVDRYRNRSAGTSVMVSVPGAAGNAGTAAAGRR